MTPGIQRLKHKLHPRTGFMVFFPGFVLLCLFILLLVSPRVQAGHGAQGLGAALAMDAAVVLFLIWLNLGHVVAWDDERIYVRQPDANLLLRRYPFACISFADVRAVVFHPPPRGVPPKYPLLEIQTLVPADAPPLLIDPNYFTGSSLTNFINVLREKRPELHKGQCAKAIDGLLKKLAS